MPEPEIILGFIVKQLAVSLSELAEKFRKPESKMKAELKPLVDHNLIRETTASGKVFYSITAEGASALEKPSLSKKIAAIL